MNTDNYQDVRINGRLICELDPHRLIIRHRKAGDVGYADIRDMIERAGWRLSRAVCAVDGLICVAGE